MDKKRKFDEIPYSKEFQAHETEFNNADKEFHDKLASYILRG